MLDSDLAELYGVETKRINEQIKRNITRFPDDFMFQLSKQEFINLKSQFATSSWGGKRKIPYAFTEHGVAMLASVLKSETAIQVNIQIIRAFVAARQMLMYPSMERTVDLQRELKELRIFMDEVLTDQNDINEDTRMQLELINQTLAEMQVKNKANNNQRRKIGF